MSVVPTASIKAAFLKVLYENIVSKKPIHPIYLIQAVVKRYLPQQKFPIDSQVIKVTISELERDGYIKPSKHGLYILTKKGVDQSLKPLDQIRLPSVDLFPLISSNYMLMKAIHNDYIEGDHESVVFKSFKLLEESVREKAKLTEDDYGKELMSKAFKPRVGRLKYPNAKTNAEQDSLHELMRGAIGFYKNPKSHRTIEIEDPNKVIKMVLFAKLLLDIVGECVLNPAPGSDAASNP